MASDLVEQIIGEVESITGADPNMARLWVRDAFRGCMRYRRWSFCHRRTNLILPPQFSSTTAPTIATAQVTLGSTLIRFSSPVAVTDMVKMQFRVGVGPIYDVVSRPSASTLEIRPGWSEASIAATPWSIIKCYVEMPADAKQILAVVNTQVPRALRLNYQREILDYRDPNRMRYGTGIPRLLCPLDWSLHPSGTPRPTLRMGSGVADSPLAAGVYTGQADAVFTIQLTDIDLGNIVSFLWWKDEELLGSNVTGNTTVGNQLSDGISVLWDAAGNYSIGDIFVIVAKASAILGVPRQEIYPVANGLMALPMVYVAQYPDVTDEGVELPPLFARNTDVLKESALEQAANQPEGSSKYAQINRREYHAARAFLMLKALDGEDNLIVQRDALLQVPMYDDPWSFGDPQITDPPGSYDSFTANF